MTLENAAERGKRAERRLCALILVNRGHLANASARQMPRAAA
jgi:hypothetical protein